MQGLVKQVLKQSKNLIKNQPKNSYFTVAKKVNREAYAKQCFAQKMYILNSIQQMQVSSLQYKTFQNFSYPSHQKLAMPALSPSMERGKIQKWNFKEGDKIEVGEAICEVETDKSTVGFEATEELYLAKILVPEGEELQVGQIVAVAVDNKANVDAFKSYVLDSSSSAGSSSQSSSQSQPSSQPQSQPQQQQQQQQQTIQSQTSSDDRIKASPLARHTANQLGVDLSQVKGQGFGGRIILDDVLNARGGQAQAPVQQQQQQPSQQQQAQSQQDVKQEQKKKEIQFTSTPGENPYIDIPNTSTRKAIAKRLQESKQTVPHFQLSIDVNVDKLLAVRKQLNANEGIKVSVNDFIIKASALALRDYPKANAKWYDDKIRQFKNADISVAVSTDGGLITPIVFEANNKGLKEISQQVKSLAAKARENKLQPNEYQGGTFTISNLGMYGIDAFTAIINPPQACILAVSQSNKKLVYDPAKEGQEIPFSAANIMNVTLSCDHRVVDGAVGAEFLQKFKFYIENPVNMLL